jgi:hypothetical protein
MGETPAQRYWKIQDRTTGHVENRSHKPKVVGSNPTPATKKPRSEPVPRDRLLRVVARGHMVDTSALTTRPSPRSWSPSPTLSGEPPAGTGTSSPPTTSGTVASQRSAESCATPPQPRLATANDPARRAGRMGWVMYPVSLAVGPWRWWRVFPPSPMKCERRLEPQLNTPRFALDGLAVRSCEFSASRSMAPRIRG